MKRKIYENLMKWKSRSHKSLVVKGQRQVGKTYIIDAFGRENYGAYLRVDLSMEPEVHHIFEKRSKVDDILSDLAVYHPGFKPVPGDTLLYLDEIQECPRARTLLKLFTIDGRYDVIASGSLLGVSESRLGTFAKDVPPLLPVGYEEHLTLRSMDFEEFLWARSYPAERIEEVKRCMREGTPVDDVTFSTMSEAFRDFMRIGGMPEAVSRFLTSGYTEAQNALDDILETCVNDINRYNTGINAMKTNRCFNSIPSQLAETNKRFTYSRLDNDGKGRSSAEKYMENLLWIEAAGYGNFCRSLTQLALPLERNTRPDMFRVYMSDTGMLVHMYRDKTAAAILENNLAYNLGAVAENMVAECITKNGLVPRYYLKSSGTDKMELDFVLDLGDELTAVEVKSGRHREYTSVSRANVDRRVVFEDANISVDEQGMEHYPLFCAAFISQLIRT